MGQATSRWDYFKRPEWGFPESTTGPKAPRPPTPGLNLPLGTHIPDWRQYKVEDIPELVEVKQKLAAQGLKDPWLRNEVWRYDRKLFATKGWRIWGPLAPGLIYGFGMFLVVVICEETIFKKKGGHH